MKRLLAVISLSVSAALACVHAQAQSVDPLANFLSADAASAAAARGASVVDIRDAAAYARGHLPGAISVPGLGAADSLQALQGLVSRHGVDLSREVLIVGLPGDPEAQRLQARLADYATGRVNWLVGGVHEWALSGRPLETQAAVLSPVPQHLVSLQPQTAAPRMAGAHLRDLPEAGPALASAL